MAAIDEMKSPILAAFLLAAGFVCASAAACGGNIRVEELVSLDLPATAGADCEWNIETRSDRVLMFTLQRPHQLTQSLQIVEGHSAASKFIFPADLRDSKNSTEIRVYSSASVARIRFNSRSSSEGATLHIQPAVDCPINVGIQTSCGRILNDGGCHCVTYTPRTWENSRGFCELHGMQLVSIETMEEETALENTWTNADLNFFYWTSGSDAGHEGFWVWTSTGRPFTYTNWFPGQPRNDGGVEHYLIINPSQWHDYQGTRSCGAICEAAP